MKTLFSIYKRVRGKEAKERYFDKGIKNYLSINDIKYLWFRDKAYQMEKPSIHRINNNGNYSIDNCKYLEFSKHCKIKETKNG